MFTFNQTIPQSTWIVHFNCSVESPYVFVYDDSSLALCPDGTVILEDRIELYFDVERTGFVRLIRPSELGRESLIAAINDIEEENANRRRERKSRFLR